MTIKINENLFFKQIYSHKLRSVNYFKYIDTVLKKIYPKTKIVYCGDRKGVKSDFIYIYLAIFYVLIYVKEN